MSTWDKTTPLGSDPKSQGDDRIRETKAALEDALQADGGIFPGPNPSTAPVYYPVIVKAAEASRPAASTDYPGRMFMNEDTGTLQRVADDGLSYEDMTKNPATQAIHQAPPAALATVAGVATLPETGNSFNVSGLEAVTQLAGWQQGVVIIKWGSSRTLTHAAGFYLKGAVTRVVAAGDISVFEFTGVGTVREIAVCGVGPLGTRQVFLTGSGTYTTPVGAIQLRVRMVGGGGGGGGQGASISSAAQAGGNSSFNSIVAAGGGAGGDNVNAFGQGGLGGTGGTGSASFRIAGGGGGSGSSGSTGSNAAGASSALGGGAPGTGSNAANGLAAGANTGGGGGGAGKSGFSGGGGGGGEYVEYVVSNPAASYAYAVGAGGAGGIGANQTGGAGGSGIIIVDELY